ncbi:transposable element Tc1 transposase [Trichonephila clavipes]|nr:transposable element Tc1 transposase [Trichonephila clavipes]
MHDCWKQEMVLPLEAGAPGGPMALLTGKTTIFGVWLRRVVLRLWQKFKCPVRCPPLTPSHCRLRRLWRQPRDHWKMEWKSAVFSDGSAFGANDGRVLVKRRPGEHLGVSA